MASTGPSIDGCWGGGFPARYPDVDPLRYIVVVGALATNVIGSGSRSVPKARLCGSLSSRTIYAPVKQSVARLFARQRNVGFKRVVMIDEAKADRLWGSPQRDSPVIAGAALEAIVAVYVPTNHLYLGDIVDPRPRASRSSGTSALKTGSGSPDRRHGAACPGVLLIRPLSRTAFRTSGLIRTLRRAPGLLARGFVRAERWS